MNKSSSTKAVLPLLVIALVITAYYFVSVLQKKPCPLSNYLATTVQINQHKLTVDIASTEDERSCGLAHRTSLPNDYGMLFVFEKNQTLNFWMKDTFVPLTIAYIDENHLITELHSFAANQADVDAPSKTKGRYALESSPEWFSNNNIRIGDYVEFSLPE